MVLGCGLMGPTIAKDCAENNDVTKVLACDIDKEKLQKTVNFVSSSKLKTAILDVTDHKALVKKMKEAGIL